MSYLSPDELLLATAPNTSFSQSLPGLQLAWDSTSLGTFKECPYKYYLSHILGYQPRSISVHLTFGLHYHAALERYDHGRSAGLDHESALHSALQYAMEATWDRSMQRPWISDDPYKNRLTLIRSIIWYLDDYKDDTLHTIQLANGKPAVELSFQFETSYHSKETNQNYTLCGHLDKLAQLGDEIYISDKKTSKSTISSDFFDKFTPDNQMSLYDFAGAVVYNMPIKAIIIDAAQIAVTFTRFTRGFVHRTAALRQEWYEDLGQWLGLAEYYAIDNRWPRNEKSCGAYGGCPYRAICSKNPSSRSDWLKVGYSKRVWDPLVARGDI